VAGYAPSVGLFVTCLVDLIRPTVGFASIQLLERAGCVVSVPRIQTCCGQPAFNSGDRKNAQLIAAQVLDAFEGYDYVVAPSGSCAAMIRRHYPTLFDAGSELALQAASLAERTYELVSFLTDVRGLHTVDAEYSHRVTYHDACSGLRELGIERQPRYLLESVRGLEIVDLQDKEHCCGFGGIFCVKYPEISNRMVADKVTAIVLADAEVVLSGDLGCLINIAGRLTRGGFGVSVRHVAEVLADMTDEPPIGEA
jgi:L-lactate dehydrogenase complex protein LldE